MTAMGNACPSLTGRIIGVGYCLKYRPGAKLLWQTPDRPSPTLTAAPNTMSGFLLIEHDDDEGAA